VGPQAPSEGFFERGVFYLRNQESLRDTDDAIQMFNRAVQEKPELARGWAKLGEAYWRRYQYHTHDASSLEAAVQAVARALELNPALREARYAKARGLIAQDSLGAATDLLNELVGVHPEYSAPWAALGEVHRIQKNYAEGLDALNRAIALDPDYHRYHLALGYFFNAFSEYDAAADAFQEGTELRPDSRRAWNNLGTAYLRTERPEKAVEAFTRSLKIEESGSARSNLGTAYYFLGMYAQAADHYVRGTLLEPGKGVHWANLGDAVKKMGGTETRALYEAAVRLARERVELTPNDPYAHISLGLYCARAGNEDCAIREGTVAAEMQPQDAVITFKAAIIFTVLGRQRVALDWLERAVKLGVSKAEIENDPDLGDLAVDPRYQRILDLAS
jgi:tetratricopeptide (TPR) repeat protein